MNFWEKRRWKKIVVQMEREASHVYHMRRDVLSEQELTALQEGKQRLRAAWKQKDSQALERACEHLSGLLTRLNPPKAFPRLAENVEVLAVALAVAMGFRTYFIQPFKIPTASMQPTLYGVTVSPQVSREVWDYFPLNVVRLAVFGERFKEIRAVVSGTVGAAVKGYDRDSDSYLISIGGVSHKVPRGMHIHVAPGQRVEKGTVIASGRVRIGDHIFVNKVRYNFTRPKRGDVIVFSTEGIDFPDIRPNTFYIKRLAALPGDEVALIPPYLWVNGEQQKEPPIFRKIAEAEDQGYHGYVPVNPQFSHVAWLPAAGIAKRVPEHHYLPLGDNSRNSLDGRYFGPIPEKNLVGPAFFVYWPFGQRFGLIE